MLARGVGGFPEVEGGADPLGSTSLVPDQGSNILDDQSQGMMVVKETELISAGAAQDMAE